jgi:hypothetical protein
VQRLALDQLVTGAASAAVLNFTATGSSASGYVVVWNCNQTMPATSSLNFTTVGSVANLVITGLSSSHDVCFSTNAPTDLVADLQGQLDVGSPYHSLRSPVRLVDTRQGLGSARTLSAGATLTVGTRVPDAFPADAQSVVLNVTAAQPREDGFITVWPCDEPRPSTSNLNFGAHETVAAAVVSRATDEGAVCLYSSATTDIVLDGSGYLLNDLGYHSLRSPIRIVDTRSASPPSLPSTPTTATTGAPQAISK